MPIASLSRASSIPVQEKHLCHVSHLECCDMWGGALVTWKHNGNAQAGSSSRGNETIPEKAKKRQGRGGGRKKGERAARTAHERHSTRERTTHIKKPHNSQLRKGLLSKQCVTHTPQIHKTGQTFYYLFKYLETGLSPPPPCCCSIQMFGSHNRESLSSLAMAFEALKS